jgi:flagellar hook-associated protein 1 FlgK
MSLFDSLSSAARSLQAQQFGLDVVGQNIANVNTPGYSRREALFAAVPPYIPLSAGGGVEVTGLRAQRDERIERRLLQERPAEQREAAIAGSLSIVEAAIGQPGQSIDAALNRFFDSVNQVAADPTSAVARREAALQGDLLARGIQDMAGRLEAARRDADTGVRTAVDQVNTLAARIAKLNDALGATGGGEGGDLALEDEMGEALRQLSGLMDVWAIPRAEGGFDVTYGNGRPLVVGANVYAIDVSSTPPSGFASLESAGVPVNSEITGGTIGGLVHARDVLIPGYQDQLDALAYGLATNVNTVHEAGYDLAGNTGTPFFTPPGAVAGAARTISVSAGILADPSTIAASATGQPGDNDVARQLAGLRDARVLAGGTRTLADAWGTLTYTVGSDTQAARQEQASRGEIVRQIELLREQASGVSLDEEAMMMMKFQRAYEANARFFRAVDSSLDTLLNLVGR